MAPDGCKHATTVCPRAFSLWLCALARAHLGLSQPCAAVGMSAVPDGSAPREDEAAARLAHRSHRLYADSGEDKRKDPQPTPGAAPGPVFPLLFLSWSRPARSPPHTHSGHALAKSHSPLHYWEGDGGRTEAKERSCVSVFCVQAPLPRNAPQRRPKFSAANTSGPQRPRRTSRGPRRECRRSTRESAESLKGGGGTCPRGGTGQRACECCGVFAFCGCKCG